MSQEIKRELVGEAQTVIAELAGSNEITAQETMDALEEVQIYLENKIELQKQFIKLGEHL